MELTYQPYLQDGNLLSQTKVGQLERKLKGSPRSMDSMYEITST